MNGQSRVSRNVRMSEARRIAWQQERRGKGSALLVCPNGHITEVAEWGTPPLGCPYTLPVRCGLPLSKHDGRKSRTSTARRGVDATRKAVTS